VAPLQAFQHSNGKQSSQEGRNDSPRFCKATVTADTAGRIGRCSREREEEREMLIKNALITSHRTAQGDPYTVLRCTECIDGWAGDGNGVAFAIQQLGSQFILGSAGF